jgi:hypothetical protein
LNAAIARCDISTANNNVSAYSDTPQIAHLANCTGVCCLFGHIRESIFLLLLEALSPVSISFWEWRQEFAGSPHPDCYTGNRAAQKPTDNLRGPFAFWRMCCSLSLVSGRICA